MKTNSLTRIFSMVLVLVMVAGILPTGVFAKAPQPEWAQWNESPAESVTVTFTMSHDGAIMIGNDLAQTPLSKVTMEVPYFDLSLYDLGDFTRYSPETGEQIYRPTMLHAMIVALELYHWGLDPNQVGQGYPLRYNNPPVAYARNASEELIVAGTGGVSLDVKGSAGSMWVTHFWGNTTENFLFYRNHAEGLIYYDESDAYNDGSGWYSSLSTTADYCLLEDGDTLDWATFTNSPWAGGGNAYMQDFEQGSEQLTLEADTGYTWYSDFYDVNWSNNSEVPLIWEVRSCDRREIMARSDVAMPEYNFVFSAPGEYEVIGYGESYGTADCSVMPAVARVTVVEAEPEPTQPVLEGSFLLMAGNADGYLIEPEWVDYYTGDTLTDALKASGHTFSGIDNGFITAIDGVADNYSLHHSSGEGYALDAPASQVVAVYFTNNSNQTSSSFAGLAALTARYMADENGIQSYSAAQTAYAAAEAGICTADDATANALYADLLAAFNTFEVYLKQEAVTVSLDITLGDESLPEGGAAFTSEYGTVTTVNELTEVALRPGSYSFDISDGSFRHVRGTFAVTKDGENVLTAQVPAGDWIGAVSTGIESNWSADEELRKENITEASGTYYVPDYGYGHLYSYVEKGDFTGDKVYLYMAGDPDTAGKRRSWNSKVTSSSWVYEGDSLEDTVLVYEARYTLENGYQQYHTYTMTLLRTPSLADLKLQSDGTALKLDFVNTTAEYAVNASTDTVELIPTVLCAEAAVTVAGQAAESGKAVSVVLASCRQDEEGAYLIPVVLTAPNGQQTEYTVAVTKVIAATVTFTHDEDVTVEVYNSVNAPVQPASVGATQTVYALIPGDAYTWISTKSDYYHATADFTATEGMTVAAATPKAEDWLTALGAAPSSSSSAVPYAVDSAFTPADHEYIFTVESNSTGFYMNAVPLSTSTYSVSAIYNGHRNTNYSATVYTKTPNTAAGKYSAMANFVAAGGWGNTMTVKVTQKTAENGVTYYQNYDVEAIRAMTLNSMSATDISDNKVVLTQKDTTTTTFNKLTYQYTAAIAQQAGSMKVIFRPVSSTKNDAQMTVTVACGDWRQTFHYDLEKNTPSTEVTATVPLDPEKALESITLTVAHDDPEAVAQTYTIEVTKLPPVPTTIALTPATAAVVLTNDVTGQRIFPEANGQYRLDSDTAYTLIATQSGYIGQKFGFTAGEENANITVTLEQAPPSTLTDIEQEGDWPYFRADANNNGVVSVATPVYAEDAVLEWAKAGLGDGYGSGAMGCPIIVGDYIYAYAKKAIVKINKDTGEVVKAGEMVTNSSFAINSPAYAEGMIFVGLSGGRVQAFDAVTLESLWVYKDALGGQPNCPIAYYGGYIYTGFWNAETRQANFVCLSVTDEDTQQTTEEKLPTWTYAHNGFYWAGAYACEEFVLVGTDDGEGGYTTGTASLLSLNPLTGELIDTVKLSNVGDQRSSICYDVGTDAYYFTTKGGDFYQVRMNGDGTITEGSLRRLKLDNGSNDDATPAMSTSTPVVYKGRAYIGVSGTSQFGAYSGHNITVIDLESFTIAYSVPTQGYPQTSGLLTNAYEDTDGYVYVYFFDNYTPGKLRVIRDKKGMTEVDHTYTTMEPTTVDGEQVMIETAYVLFTPHGAQAQYAICSPIVDADGNIYFKNDSAQMMRLSSRITSLEVKQLPDKTQYSVGETFDPTGMQVIAHYANGVTKDITDLLAYSTEALTLEDTELTVSYDYTKLCKEPEEEGAEKENNWQWYQNKDGTAGVAYRIPTASVTLEIKDVEVVFSVTLDSVLGVNIKVPDGYRPAVFVGDAEAEQMTTANGVCTVNVFAQDMLKPITAKLYNTDGTLVCEKVFTLTEYVEKIQAMEDASEPTKALAQATLNYCQCAARVKGNYDGEMNVLAAIPEGALEGYPFTTGRVPAGTSIHCYLEEACELRLRMTTDAYTVLVDGEAVEAKQTGDTYVYSAGQLLAQDYDRSHTFTIMEGDTPVFSGDYSVLSYIGRYLSSTAKTKDMTNLITAMYHYYAAADAYLAANQ